MVGYVLTKFTDISPIKVLYDGVRTITMGFIAKLENSNFVEPYTFCNKPRFGTAHS